MTKVAVFGGTTEGRHIAEFCDKNKIDCTYFAATEAGKNEVTNCRNIEIIQGRLSLEKMKLVFENGGYSKIIDATHPYALEVSENIKKACRELGLSYLRVIRDEGKIETNAAIYYADNMDDIINRLNACDGNILVTTGSKDAEEYKKVKQYEKRVYLRILPDNNTVVKLCSNGFLKEHIITGKGPFSLEENIKALKETKSRVLVTKQSGKTGGYNEKIKAAEMCDCEVFCLKRPIEDGVSESEAMEILKEMSKNHVHIIGIGVGNTAFLCHRAKEIIENADVIIGANRVVLSCKDYISESAEIFESYDSEIIASKISTIDNLSVAVLMSGDTGFFSGAKKLGEKLGERVQIIPGISSMSYMASKIGISWEDAYAVSMHGRKCNLPFAVLTHEKTFVLTDGNIYDIMYLLKEYNLADVTVYIGKDLSLDSEKLIKVTPQNYVASKENEGLISLFIINNSYENRMRFICDSEFIRNETPMTKEAVRNIIVSRFNVKENAVIYDIGSGSGSVSLMLARLAPKGKVYAFDMSVKAMEVLELNKRKFSTDHITGILGTVPESINENNLPQPDAVFIGGSSGKFSEIAKLFEGKHIPFVITAIAIETFIEVMELIDNGKIKSVDISQLFISERSELGRYHYMKPQNPVWIISGIF